MSASINDATQVEPFVWAYKWNGSVGKIFCQIFYTKKELYMDVVPIANEFFDKENPTFVN